MGCTNRNNSHVRKVILTFKKLGWYVHILAYRSFATGVSQLNIWHFWVIDIERNICRFTFNRYSVITQFANLAAGEQLVSSSHSQKIIALWKSLLKNHRFWVVSVLSQMSDMLYEKKRVLLEQKKDKIQNKWCFVENKLRLCGLS
jgi:hypothetical protein